MFARFLNKISSFVKFNANALLTTGAIEYINEFTNRTKAKFDNSPQDNPEELGEAEYRSRLVIRQAFQDLGLDSSYEKLRFAECKNTYFDAFAWPNYFNRQGKVTLIEKQIYPKNYVIPNAELDSHYKKWYSIGGHEGWHIKNHDNIKRAAATVYSVGITSYVADHVLTKTRFYKNLNKYNAFILQHGSTMGIILTLTHYYHVRTELAADRQSIKALNTAYDLYENFESSSQNQTTFSRIKAIVSNPKRAYDEGVLFNPNPTTSKNQIRELAKEQQSPTSRFFESETYKILQARQTLLDETSNVMDTPRTSA